MQTSAKVGNKYEIIKKIGEGSFSIIYEAINTKTNQKVAVKVEPIDTQHPQLIYECKLYKYLHK
jgi:serine/threonine protein kinase